MKDGPQMLMLAYEDVAPKPMMVHNANDTPNADDDFDDGHVDSATKDDDKEVMEISDDDDDDKEEVGVASADGGGAAGGDPSRAPGEDSDAPIESSLLVPFQHGWKRECVMRDMRKGGVATKDCDIYYIPPPKDPPTRDANRKRRSKKDLEKYFEDYPNDNMTTINFSYVGRPLGLNNPAYEFVRNARDGLRLSSNNRKTSVNYKEPEESSGLISESDDDNDDDDDDDIMEEFSSEMTILHSVVELF